MSPLQYIVTSDAEITSTSVDLYQEKVKGQGPQNNESAAEQFQDEQISDAIRRYAADSSLLGYRYAG